MRETSDIELLRQYAREGSEEAFEKVMAAHVNLVYSVALRKTGNTHAAEEITQAVFIILAQKADALRRGTILSGWLYQTARLTAANYLRTEIRRFHREKEACVQSLNNETGPDLWPQIAPLVEDAMGRLGGKDRDAIVLRFMEGKDFREIGAAFGASENAAKKRVGRALEKLRKLLARQGIISTSAVITGAIAGNSIQIAPVGLAKSVSAVAIAKGATASSSTLILVKGALKLMACTKTKAAMLFGGGVLLAAGTATVAVLEVEKLAAPVAVVSAWNSSAYPWQAEGFATNTNGGQSINGNFLLGAKAPPLLEIRPTVVRDGVSMMASVETSPGEDKRLGFGYTVQDMLRTAYGFSWTQCRMIPDTPLPEGRYDFIDNLNRGATQAFEDALARQFGITCRIVTRETNVLLLQVLNPYAPGLRPSAPGAAYQNSQSSGPESREYHITGIPFSNWVTYCESDLKIPVVDGTGLTGNYDVNFKWRWNPGASENDAFQQTLRDELGLELVPAREEIEMLLIEKNTKPVSWPPPTALETVEDKPPAVVSGQVWFPKASWASAGYAFPKDALQTYFWALDKQDPASFKASMTTGAEEEFTKGLHDARETDAQFMAELSPIIKKISGYRILETNVSDVLTFRIALTGGVNKTDRMAMRLVVGTGWKVDEIPLHFSEPDPQPTVPAQVYYPKASWTFAGYASPEAALETYFWAIDSQDATNVEASMTAGARGDFTEEVQAAGKTKAQYLSETGLVLKKVSSYRILGVEPIAADEIDFKISTEGGENVSDVMTVKKIGTEWKVDESL